MMSIRGIAALTAVSFAVAGGAALAAGPPGAAGRSASVRNAVAQAQDPARTNLSPLGQTQPISRPAEKARSDLRGSLGRQAVLTTDARTGGVKAVGKLDGFLTGRSSASAAAVALGYVRSHSDAFGLTSDDLSNLKLVRDYTSPDGVRHLQWAQVVDGFTVADSSLVANVAGDGRLVNVGGGIRGGLKLNRTQPSVSSDSAYASTLRSVGSNARVPAKRSARSSGTRATAYSGRGAAQLGAGTAGH